MKKAIYAGSFDPITNGHIWVINQAAKLFDEVVVVLSYNPSKTGMFPIAQRESQIKETLKEFKNVSVKTISDEYVVSVASELGAKYLIRGIRNFQDYEYEKTIERINLKINKEIQTIYITPPHELSELSSSLVKSLVGFPGWQFLLKEMVPPVVVKDFLVKMYEKDISEVWREVAGNSPTANDYLKVILDKYSEPHRYYHNLKHLDSLIKHTRVLFNNKKSLDFNSLKTILFAIFFHDLVYDPKSKTNELDSAQMWLDYVKDVKTDQVIKDPVYNMILATAKHTENYEDELTNYFLDLDLSILGVSEKEYKNYEKEIREEYSFIPEEVFQVERKKIMAKFTNPYKTPWAKALWGKQSERNLKTYKK